MTGILDNSKIIQVIATDASGTPTGGSTTATYSTPLPTLTNGQTTPLQSDTKGSISVVLRRVDNGTAVGLVQDNVSITGSAGTSNLTSVAKQYVYDGANWNMQQGAVLFNNESISVLSGSATFTGTSRDIGVASGSSAQWAFFNAFVFTDQTGTLRIECSNDNSTWRTIATSAVAVSTPLILTVPVMTRYHRVVLVNGATLQTVLMVNSSYTAS